MRIALRFRRWLGSGDEGGPHFSSKRFGNLRGRTFGTTTAEALIRLRPPFLRDRSETILARMNSGPRSTWSAPMMIMLNPGPLDLDGRIVGVPNTMGWVVAFIANTIPALGRTTREDLRAAPSWSVG
jgi:hypothetical protein